MLGVQVPCEEAACVMPCVTLWDAGSEVDADTWVASSLGLETTFGVAFN